jgi:actin-related protein
MWRLSHNLGKPFIGFETNLKNGKKTEPIDTYLEGTPPPRCELKMSWAEFDSLVVDFGCSSTKMGFAGADAPSVFLPPVVGVPAGAAGPLSGPWVSKNGKRHLPQPTEHLRAGVAYQSIIDPMDGLLMDWDGATAQLDFALAARLGLGGGSAAAAATPSCAAHPVLLVEPAFTSKADREKWAQILFEQYGAPGVFMSRAGVLALYANARVTGVAVDCGAGGVTVTPVQEGYPLMGGIRRSPVGGDALDGALLAAARARGHAVAPRFPTPAPGGGGSGGAAAPAPHASVVAFHELEAARAGRHALCRVFESPFDAEANAHTPITSFDLPDGSTLSLGPERFSIPELLFDPSPLLARGGGAGAQYAGAAGLADMVTNSVMVCDIDCRRDLITNVTLTGGVSATEGISDRLLRDLTANQSTLQTRAKLAAASAAERAVGPWTGGSILASLGTFHEFWFSKKEYEEYGAKMLHRKVI